MKTEMHVAIYWDQGPGLLKSNALIVQIHQDCLVKNWQIGNVAYSLVLDQWGVWFMKFRPIPVYSFEDGRGLLEQMFVDYIRYRKLPKHLSEIQKILAEFFPNR